MEPHEQDELARKIAFAHENLKQELKAEESRKRARGCYVILLVLCFVVLLLSLLPH